MLHFSDPSVSRKRDLLMLVIAIGAFFALCLGARPYLTPSEARYIEIPRQMLATHDFLTPRINGVPYFEKPPLFYWMQAGIMNFFGMDEFAGRAVTALLVLGLCLITYATSRMLFDRVSGLLAAAVLASCVLGYSLSRIATLDPPVTFFLTGAVASFLAAQHEPAQKNKRRWYWLMFASAALAVMSKGLLGIIIPGLIIGSWIALTSRWRLLKDIPWISGIALFLLIAAPWHIMMSRAHPEFTDFYFIHEHVTRYLTNEHKRVQPWWFFIAITLAGLLPWTGIIPSIIKQLKSAVWPIKTADSDALFLALWILLPLVFFSASHSKLVPYIFPIFPPLAILCGCWLAHVWEAKTSATPLRLAALFAASLFGAAIVIYRITPQSFDVSNKLGLSDALTLNTLLPLLVVSVALIYMVLIRVSARKIILGLLLLAATIDITVNNVAGDIDRASIKSIAANLKNEIKPDDLVVAYGTYFQDLPVYLNRNVTVAGWTGELNFGVTHYPETTGWMISTDEFWKRCADAKRIYMFVKQETFASLTPHKNCRLQAWAAAGKNLLVIKEKEPEKEKPKGKAKK